MHLSGHQALRHGALRHRRFESSFRRRFSSTPSDFVRFPEGRVSSDGFEGGGQVGAAERQTGFTPVGLWKPRVDKRGHAPKVGGEPTILLYARLAMLGKIGKQHCIFVQSKGHNCNLGTFRRAFFSCDASLDFCHFSRNCPITESRNQPLAWSKTWPSRHQDKINGVPSKTKPRWQT